MLCYFILFYANGRTDLKTESLPKVIWGEGRVAAGFPGRGRCTTAPWRAFMNMQADRQRLQRLSSHHGQQHFLLRAFEFW